MVPDVENFKYDYDKNVLVRENVHLVLNPEDASALAVALKLKQEVPDTYIETVSMAPRGVMPHLEDLVRRGVDRATLISDSGYVGSDTYVTSRILHRYIQSQTYDWIFSGNHSLDGGTAHVPAQIAELLGISHMANIIEIDRSRLVGGRAEVSVECEDALFRFELARPAFLSFQYSTKIKLPYIKYEKINQDVSDRIELLSNEDLEFSESELGLNGSLTKVAKVEVKKLARKDTRFLRNDEEGIDTVIQLLRNQGLVE